MGDWLRRLLYPLVLPMIVLTVWLCGWVRQQDDRMVRDHLGYPPLKEARFLWTDAGNARDDEDDDSARPARPNPPRHAFFAAAAADDDAVDEP